MKIKIKYISLLIIPYIAYLLFGILLTNLFKSYQNSSLVFSLVLMIILLTPLLITFFWLIKIFDLQEFNGVKFKNSKVLLIPLLFLIFIIIKNFNIYSNSNILELIILMTSVLLTGFTEEFYFRGMLLPYFMNVFQSKKYSLYLSIFLSSIVFGVFHYLNLFNSSSENIASATIQVTFQVIFAFFVGIFLCALLLRTKSIIIPSLIHALINFEYQTFVLKGKKTSVITESLDKNLPDRYFWNLFIQELPTYIFLLIFGIVLIRKVNKIEWLQRFEK